MSLRKIITITAALFLSISTLRAQFYKVYGYQPAEAGEIEFSLWNSYIPSSDAAYAFFEKGSRPVDIAIYLEYIINNKDYKDYEELEIRLILEKDIGAFTIDFNPSAFIDSDGNFTYGQWYATKDIENRLRPLEERIERYHWTVPEKFVGKTVILRAVLNYRRMPDSYAKYLGIPTRPAIEVSRDERVLKISE